MSALAYPTAKGNRALHVLTLTALFPSAENNTNGCFVAEPLDLLSAENVSSSVFAVQPFYREKNHPLGRSAPAQWFRYFSLPGGLGLSSTGALTFARIVARVRKLHEQQPIDLIHAHSALPCGHAAMLLNHELGIPYVVSVHGLDAFSSNQVSGMAGLWCRRISQRVYASSRRVICISERVREEVIEGMGRAGRTSVVYNGVDVELFSPSETPAETSLILSVGNLIPIKGHEFLLLAVAALTPEFPGLRLEIVGEGPELLRLKQLAGKLNIASRIWFLGRRSRSEVAIAMRRCTLFALPSRYEGLGCVYLEAMSAAKPVIGCRGQGIAEIIRHGTNGFLVGCGNEKELTLAITMLLRDENLRRNLGRAARDTILDRFTLAHQAEALVRIYRESLA